MTTIYIIVNSFFSLLSLPNIFYDESFTFARFDALKKTFLVCSLRGGGQEGVELDAVEKLSTVLYRYYIR